MDTGRYFWNRLLNTTFRLAETISQNNDLWTLPLNKKIPGISIINVRTIYSTWNKWRTLVIISMDQVLTFVLKLIASSDAQSNAGKHVKSNIACTRSHRFSLLIGPNAVECYDVISRLLLDQSDDPINGLSIRRIRHHLI